MAEGWVKLHRSITENWIWDNPQYLKWWLDLILMANHKEKKILFNGSFKKVDVGQRITSEQKLAERWGVSRNTVRKFLSLLVEDDMISIEKSRKNGTTYKVNNYAIYQGFSEEKKQQTEQRAEHQKDNELNINKNDKNDKNEKNNNNPRNSRKTREYADDDPNKKLAILLLKLIRKNQNIKEPDLDKWANTIRLTIESDKRTGREVQDMIVWATSNDFWSGVILSPTSLRKHFDKMAIQKNKRKQQNISNDELPETGEDW
ncbi:GntR family transcriptional regulator [Enterococcus faecium]|uniref:GntR family transcriptional regulator n=1 Tax=Enterococcus faecium TaxID=1352 RepID=UPI001C8FDC24|nr:GntR family transcriptional regulator [Enterococcus faecium]MBY3628319.1 GntR family transcriptional regulator [Enterococcus faecium]